WAALAAIPTAAQADSFTFPHAGRGDFFSTLGLISLSDSEQTVTVNYITAGNTIAGSRQLTLFPNVAVRLTAADLFGAAEDSGTITVTGGTKLIGYMVFGKLSGASFAAVQGQSRGQREFILP